MRVAVKYIASVLMVFVGFSMAAGQENRPPVEPGELHQLLAPIALYPDALLSQILMASTYPLEVVAAARWSRDNPRVEGQNAVAAVAGTDWDPSVKAMVAFPQILARMSEDLEWTRRLGDAFVLHEAQVMDAVQELRHQALAAGTLDSMEHARAYREEEQIAVKPASPEVVYVPHYHPGVYGGWLWPAYPPVFWGWAPGLHAGRVFFWSGGIRVAPGFFFSHFHWPRRHIVIVHRHLHPSPSGLAVHSSGRTFYKWRHDPRHRRGIAYRHNFGERRSDPLFSRWSNLPEAPATAAQGRPPVSQRGRSFSDRDSTLHSTQGFSSPAGRAHGGADGGRRGGAGFGRGTSAGSGGGGRFR